MNLLKYPLIRILCIALFTTPLTAFQEPLEISGFLSARSLDASGPWSWLEGGEGKFLSGDNRDGSAAGNLQIGLTWRPNLYFKAHVHAIGRLEEDGIDTLDGGGISEAFVQLAALGDQHRFTTKAGIFLPPTSMENTDDLWASPYTQTFSALNTWIGEEVRLTGLELGYQYEWGENKTLFGGASVFWGNDAAGSLLFWRGWAMSDRLTTWRETVPLPQLASLQAGQPFYAQLDDGAIPYGSDLDGKAGAMGHLGFEWAGRLVVQANYLDNMGDRELHGWEYAWQTRFFSAGMELFVSDELTLMAEFMDGSTGMGERNAPHAQADFTTWYALASYEVSPGLRISARYDDYEMVDIDALTTVNADLNDETGDAVTLALFWFPWEQIRLGVEYVELTNDRPTELVSGLTNVTGGESLGLEIRYIFP